MAPKQPITPRPGKSLADMHPAIGKDIDPELNGGLTANNLSPSDTYKPTWRCHLGHIKVTSLRARVKFGGCSLCAHVPPYEESFEYLYPELAAQFDEELTGIPGVSPRTVKPTASWKLGWRCEYGHGWKATMHSRINQGSGCPTCYKARRNGLQPNESVYLKDRDPVAFAMIHPDDNPAVDLGTLTPGSHTHIVYRCPNGHACPSSVKDFTRRHSTAPYGCRTCKYEQHGDLASVPKGGNSLAEAGVDYLDEWDYEKNYPLTPYDVTPASSRKRWWRCGECSGSWHASPHSRSKGHGCPPCALIANAEVRSMVSAEESFGTTHPHLAPEWDEEKNAELGRSPFNVSAGSDLRPWWKCSEGHSWAVSVYSRTSKGSQCPDCIGWGTSAAEQFVVEALASLPELELADDLNNEVVRDIQWGDRSGPMKVDALLELVETGDMIAFEYDGEYWHSSADNFARDQRKTQALLNYGNIVVRLREGSLGHLDMEHPRLLQVTAPTPNGDAQRIEPAVKEIIGWLRKTRYALAA